MQDNKLKQDDIEFNGKTFFVSTINRESSASLNYRSMYAETMVWEINPETRLRGAFVGQDEHAENSLYAHNRVCENLRKYGTVDEPDED